MLPHKITTKQLAQQQNVIESIQVVQNKTNDRNPYSIQTFSYLIVLDFEATCVEHKDKKFPSELIEFSAVLYNVNTAEILTEFQQYVKPVENPQLSKFCTTLTGITQETVDNGVPLKTCVTLFDQWIKKQQKRFKITLLNTTKPANCAFVTWTNWDLGNCLYNECRRKKLKFQDYFRKWIDLKELYMNHYCRTPKGLEGALNEVGLLFEGKQHCGLDDAKNTAFLAGRMIKDGVLLKITRHKYC